VQEHAVEEREKYKEGKSIVEKAKVMKVRVPCSSNLHYAATNASPRLCIKQPDIILHSRRGLGRCRRDHGDQSALLYGWDLTQEMRLCFG
jgi:hypothetical protein